MHRRANESQILYKIVCKSLEGDFLSINIQDFNKFLLKDDETIQILYDQFKNKATC